MQSLRLLEKPKTNNGTNIKRSTPTQIYHFTSIIFHAVKDSVYHFIRWSKRQIVPLCQQLTQVARR